MKVTLAYAERQLRHWTKKVAELRLTSNAFDASNTERNEEEKRNIPPTPPIRRKEEAKKETTTTTRVRRFQKPTIEEVAEYCKERGYNLDAEHFWNYYEAKGWVVGRSPMKNWHAAIATWARRDVARVLRPVTASPRVSGMVDRVKHADNYLPPSESLLKRLKGLSNVES